MTRAWRVVISIAFLFAMSGFSACELRAQTIHVDAAAGHATNTIVPTQALGAGIDRLRYGASDGQHKLFAASSDVMDGAGHTLVTAYAALRPDGQWSLMVVNKDQENAHEVTIAFDGAKASASSGNGSANGFAGAVDGVTFGAAQYQWHPGPNGGHADPDAPAARCTVNANAATKFVLPAASVTVLRGKTAK